MKKWFIRIPLILLGLLVALVLLAAGVFWLTNRNNGTLVSAGEKRHYLLYVPESYDPTVPTPLVITLHGFAQWPANQAAVSRWNETGRRIRLYRGLPGWDGLASCAGARGVTPAAPPIRCRMSRLSRI